MSILDTQKDDYHWWFSRIKFPESSSGQAGTSYLTDKEQIINR
jgi:hypothetical protein